MKITECLWLDSFVDKIIRKHGVFPEEIEEAFSGNAFVRRLEGGHVKGKEKIMGKELEFESYEDAGKWFEKSDMGDYREQLVPVELTFDLRKRRDLFELDREIAKTVRILAKKRNVPARHFVNELLRETIEGLR